MYIVRVASIYVFCHLIWCFYLPVGNSQFSWYNSFQMTPFHFRYKEVNLIFSIEGARDKKIKKIKIDFLYSFKVTVSKSQTFFWQFVTVECHLFSTLEASFKMAVKKTILKPAKNIIVSHLKEKKNKNRLAISIPTTFFVKCCYSYGTTSVA